jgi:tetratricopeptide (TPR) repeat protein
MTALSPIIFLHIPKTAGVTIHYILLNKYRWKKFFTSKNYKQIKEFENLAISDRAKIKVLDGHFGFGVHNLFPTPPTYFTILRDPIKRSISGYNFLYQHTQHPFHKTIIKEKYSLKEMLKKGYIKNFDNCHVRFLANAIDLDYGKVDENVYSIAIKNFDNYFETFGICERFDESLIYFKRKLNWSSPFYINANTSNKKTYINDFDNETVELLNHYNKYDLMLYHYACEKFDLIIKSYGDNFDKEVKTFKKLNKIQAPFRKIIRAIWAFFQN